MSIRFDNYNKQRKQTNVSAANALSQLETLLLTALAQQAYFRNDPDNIFTDEDDKALITKGVAALVPSWQRNVDRVTDLLAVIQGNKTVGGVVAKHSINLEEFRNGLE